jgi:lipopolysaccharide transport system ATP-binding protein
VSDTVIRIENLGKKYVIGHQQPGGYTTLRDRLTDGTQSLFRKLWTPGRKRMSNPSHEAFWALKDVSFEVQQGDCIGIIGRNGSGKSTLLKLLSRITEPTTGRIAIKGRVASLLEVGTGFHPELTGRENIYLNGAILGMSRAEISKKFDEIAAFAEIDRFLDTPVKRYSSGMYVRLAFAVAAHLEPEILIVDEVLAVGDIQFQKKCLGKMKDVSQEQGRTVLFVSHNMDAIQRLCSQCIMLEHGQLAAQGDTTSVLVRYLSSHSFKTSPKDWIDVSHLSRIGTGEARFTAVQYSGLNPEAGFQPYPNGPLEFLLTVMSDAPRTIGSLAITLYSQSGTKLVNADVAALSQILELRKGRNIVRLKIEHLNLNPDVYVLGLWMAQISSSASHAAFDYVESAFEMEVVNFSPEGRGMKLDEDDGAVTCQFKMEVTE